MILIGGKPCDGTPGYRYGSPLRESSGYHQWYICPKSGLLRRSRHVPRGRKTVVPPRRVRLNKREMCIELKGQWELVTVAPLPQAPSVGSWFDVVRKRRVWAGTGDQTAARDFYGDAVYAVSRRPLSKRELLAMPIPIEWLR